MTMFSAENRGFYINCGYGGGGYVEALGGSVMNYRLLGGYDYSCNSEACIGSDLAAVGSLMVQDDESRINQSSSKDAKEDRDEGWLQLGIGSHSHEIKQDLGNIDHQSSQRGVATNNNSNNSHSQIRPLVGLPEFGGPVMNYAGFSFLQNSSSSSSYDFPPLRHQEIINWGLIMYQFHEIINTICSMPLICLISGNFVFRDGRMIVRLVMKYFINKLRLDNESEINSVSTISKFVHPPLSDDAFTKLGLLEQINTTANQSDYLWYSLSTEMEGDEHFLKNGSQTVVHVDSLGHTLYAFINGELQGVQKEETTILKSQ